MNIETFIKKWRSEDNLDYRLEVREWMQNSYTNPFSFWEELFSYSQKEFDHPSQTILFEKYDFFSDCVARHLGKNTTALKILSADGEVQSWTYDQIHAYVNTQISYWMENHRVKAGQTVCLLLPYGIHFIVGLMTALRLGLVVSIAPIHDRFFAGRLVPQTLDQIKPDLVVAIPGQKLSEKWNLLELDLTLEKSFPSAESHVYEAGEMVQKHFNPLSEKETTLTLIEATRSYLIPLRDGIITLNLKPECCWARPLFSMLLEEPWATLTALLAGATIVYVSDQALLSNPELLKDESIQVLGVAPPLQELWIKKPGAPSGKLKLWYRNPLYGNDHSWKAFSELNHLQKTPTSQVLIDQEKGGITLYSQPKPLEILTFMSPGLGSPWKLLKSKKDLSTEGFGLFHVEPESSSEPHLIVSQVSDEWIVSTSMKPLKEGHPYPVYAVEENSKALDFVQTCMIIPERHPHHFISQQFAFLVFVSPKEHHFIQQKTEEWNQKIYELIRSELGEAFIPDRIFFYPLYPKMKKGILNRNWVESQYRSGALFLKQKRSIYHSLNLLRQSIYENMAYNAPQ